MCFGKLCNNWLCTSADLEAGCFILYLKKIDVCRVHIDFAKIHEVLCENDVGRVQVDFTQIQSFFKKLPSIECLSISSKFRESFVKLIFTKFGVFFTKFPSLDGGLISPKFGGFQAVCSSQEQQGGLAQLDHLLAQCVCDVLSIG